MISTYVHPFSTNFGTSKSLPRAVAVAVVEVKGPWDHVVNPVAMVDDSCIIHGFWKMFIRYIQSNITSTVYIYI